jgi:hypothetical protein
MKPINTLLSAIIIVVAIGAIITIAKIPPPISFTKEYRLEQEIRGLKDELDLLKSHGGAVPQWFIDDFSRVFMGSYTVQVEDDSLCVIIATSRSDFYDLAENLGFPNPMAMNARLDITDWDSWELDDDIIVNN